MISKKTALLLLSALTLSFVALNTSCKKDRIPQDDYQDMESFYSDNEEAEQEYTIDSTGGNCYFTALKGTRICITAAALEMTGGGQVTYPFQAKVIELYSVKDMILRRKPSVSGADVLETGAEIRVRPFKNGSEVFLKTNAFYNMETANLTTVNNTMDVYFGVDNGGVNNWVNTISSSVDAITNVASTASYYTLQNGKTDWVSPSRIPSSSGNTTLTLTVPGTNTNKIQSYISFAGFKGVMKIENLSSTSVPLGQQVTLICFGKKADGNFYIYQQSFNTTANQVIALAMQQTTEAGLLSALAAL